MARTLSKERIDQIFEAEGRNPAGALAKLYREAFPEWEAIQRIDGSPAVSRRTNEYICQKMIDLAGVIGGTFWVDSGFVTEEDMEDWEVRPCEYLLNERCVNV